MKPYLEQFLAWWNARLPRERQILIVGAAFVVVFMLYSAIWSPLSRARHRAEAELQTTRTLANRLEAVAADVARNRGMGGGAAATRSQALLTVVDQASHRPELGKQYEKLEPDDGDRSVKIWIDDVPFDSVVNWLNVLQTQYGIVVATAELERKGEGLVNARLSLIRP